MELPYIFDEFFGEVSLWFVIFMLTSFLIGFFTAWWMLNRTIRVLRRQVRHLKEDIVQEK